MSHYFYKLDFHLVRIYLIRKIISDITQHEICLSKEIAQLTYLTMMSLKQHTTITSNISSILYHALPSVLAKTFAMWKTSIYMQNNLILMFDMETGFFIEWILYTFQSWYFIDNYLPIWHNDPSNLVSHSHLISPYSPIEQFPPFLHIFTPPGEHLSNSYFSNSMHCNLCNEFQ